ncbi:cilium assembly protein DZIP1L-like isoform X2 [Narcine bancroftii]|uniref:cilium assembly protein DZIP1L-like isoform X2 n=1 Tax=Narcine bancroftii TaxID=1343680 RepID=UPI00383124F2
MRTVSQRALNYQIKIINGIKQQQSTTDSKHLPEISTCNEDLRKVLQKNPTIVKKLRKIVEQSLAEKLENLGITSDVQGISEGHLTRILDTVDIIREVKSKVLPNFYHFRESLSRKVEDRIKGKDSLCYLKSKIKINTSGKLSKNLNNTQPSCSKICKNIKVPSPDLSSTTLSTSSTSTGEFVGSLTSSSTSTESSGNELSETCELEEICILGEEKAAKTDDTGPQPNGSLTQIIEGELSRHIKARAAQFQIPHKKNVAGELKFIPNGKDDTRKIPSPRDDQYPLGKTEKGRNSSAFVKSGYQNQRMLSKKNPKNKDR